MTVMQAIQEKFQQFFFEEKRPVASITISDIDYAELSAEMLAQSGPMLLEDGTQADLPKYREIRVTKILDRTDGNLVELLHNPTIEQGTFVLNGA